MAEYAKRAEITTSTMGHVHNPTGAGVPSTSQFAQAKALKISSKLSSPPSSPSRPRTDSFEKTSGSSRRNITRKKSETSHESSHKKQGGHGKASWSMKSKVIEETSKNIILDKRDPNYDSEDENLAGYVLTSEGGGAGSPPRYSYNPEFRKTVVGPSLTLAEFKIRIDTGLTEYFDSGDGEEMIRIFEETGCAEFGFHMVKKAIEKSFDRGDRERELVSKLLSLSYPSTLSTNTLGRGFERLFEHLDSYILDCPSSPSYITSFLARAVVDEIIPPSFLTDPMVSQLAPDILNGAIRLLSRDHAFSRISAVWGPGDGRPVADLKASMDMLLKEFLLSRELDEALRCVVELRSSLFLHELVKRGVRVSIEGGVEDVDAMSALFKFLVGESVLSKIQMRKGLDRCFSLLPDFLLDVPNADELLERVKTNAVRDGLLEEE
ncbi:hypothetical protein TrST_g8069 [Triparma strigata]|uniref:MI domain-containing protein n=1 Tax=Triparma strigata TaxID=1606541 RepID=A0A9W7DT00_9STRA|nr:hypothetical protein TrST_g8069 [Triparma strigata]